MNDLRAPIGFFFALLGLILVAVAWLEPHARAPLTAVNINRDAGLVMLVFGLTMLWLARKSLRRKKF